MPDTTISTICSTNYAMDNPTSNITHHRNTECKQDNAQDLANAELGALDKMVIELPNICPPYGEDIAVSCGVPPTACWELSWNEASIRISSLGDDILQ